MGDMTVPGRPDGPNSPASSRQPVPAMPVIRPSERFVGPPYPLLEGPRPTLGWQEQAESKGGSSFVLMTKNALGSFKVLERFPLSQEGWASAWYALVKANPGAVEKIRETLAARAAEDLRFGNEVALLPEVAKLEARSLTCLRNVAFLGGYMPGAAMAAGQLYDVRFLQDRLIVVPCRRAEILAEIRYRDIEHVEIGGPGLVRTGGGFVGGGFGAAGAIEGMAIATVMNALTTRTSIKTVVRVQGTSCELFLLHTSVTPEQLRIHLSHSLTAIRNARSAELSSTNQHRAAPEPTSPVEELSKLAGLLQSGLLSREEFDLLKTKLLHGP